MSKKDIPAYITENGVFPTRLREVMALRGTNQTRLAAQIKKDFDITIQRQSISKYMNGQTKPDVDTITIICKALDVSADYLLGLSDEITTNMDERAVIEYTGLSNSSITTLHLLSKSPEMTFLKRFLDDFIDFSQIASSWYQINKAAQALSMATNNNNKRKLDITSDIENISNFVIGNSECFQINPLDAADYYRSLVIANISRNIDDIVSQIVDELHSMYEYHLEFNGSVTPNEITLSTSDDIELPDGF